MRQHGNRLDADYPEEVVGLMLEMFLSCFSFPFAVHSIELMSKKRERFLGADARLESRIKRFRPFYLQFKKPAAYLKESTSKIIKGRKELNLSVDPSSLYFGLREKSSNQKEFQHNVLLRLAERLQYRKLGSAVYVCPLFLDRSAYRQSMHIAGVVGWLRFLRRTPWGVSALRITSAKGEWAFSEVPVFHEHISIVPHTKVDSAKHHYSFDQSGKQLCFHSPVSLPEGSISLSSLLVQLAAEFADGGQSLTAETAVEELRAFVDAVDGQSGSQLGFNRQCIENDQPIRSWNAWGNFLSETYQINQFAFVEWN